MLTSRLFLLSDKRDLQEGIYTLLQRVSYRRFPKKERVERSNGQLAFHCDTAHGFGVYICFSTSYISQAYGNRGAQSARLYRLNDWKRGSRLHEGKEEEIGFEEGKWGA